MSLGGITSSPRVGSGALFVLAFLSFKLMISVPPQNDSTLYLCRWHCTTDTLAFKGCGPTHRGENYSPGGGCES